MGARAASASAAGTPTRERILETALRLFSERGPARVSMRELAEVAGVTVPGLYYHFDSKADLIKALYRARGLGSSLEPGAPVEQPAAERVRDRIVERARGEFARLLGDEDFLRLMQRESVLGDEDARGVGTLLAQAWRARWRDVLAGATDVAPGANLDAAADCIATFLWGLFVDYLNSGDATVVRRIDAFAELVAPALASSR